MRFSLESWKNREIEEENVKGEKNLEQQAETLIEWKNHLLTDTCVLDTLAVDNKEIETQHGRLAEKTEEQCI